MYSGYLEKGLGSCTWCVYILYLFNICTVQWLSGERVGILYMGYTIVHTFNICTVQSISGERVGILNMVYTYCVHCTCLMYVYCTVDVWRKGLFLIHGVHIFFTCLMYVLHSGYP